MQKKRNHLPIRKLIDRAGAAVQSIKPVFMMSPLSVAQFLAPGSVQFDLALIDEASQVEPVDALGAIARTTQVVVVGDDRQLPPSRFFMRLHDDEVD
jgi:superfamily I DNA and/or RNA helicase